MIAPALAAAAVVAAAVPFIRAPRRSVGFARSDDAPDRPEPRASASRVRRRVLWAIATVAVVVVAGALPALALCTIAAAWPSLRGVLAARAHARLVEAGIPDAIDMLILLVHAGMTPHQAVAMLSERGPVPVRPALVEVRRRVSRGAPLAEALDALPELLGPGALIVADTLAMAERYGTPIGRALEQLAFDVRERRRRQAEAEARKLPIRMAFPLVCCTLPSFVLLAIVPAVLAAMASLRTSGL